MLTIIIDPRRLVDLEWLHKEIDALTRYALESPQAKDTDELIMLAGEPERLSLKRRQKDGIPIDLNTWQELLTAAESVSIDPAELNSLLN
ncbi:MAG: Ldh family oxidoreductase [Deltaproteobacteria bacterium]|nr:Ldh family oxidoreductase [Deltaproteobacteria bacterium]